MNRPLPPSTRVTALAAFLMAGALSVGWTPLGDALPGMNLVEPSRLAGPSALTLKTSAPPLRDPSRASGLATFAARGEPGSFVIASIPSVDVQMEWVDANGMVRGIPVLEWQQGAIVGAPVIAWRMGGDMGDSGLARFNDSGLLPNLQVVAVAPVDNSIAVARYIGMATFRLVYQ
ncbi:MAG: hypothetical protein OEY97_07255 [Nitrospirota bacterium]|nr:hypothetical protein [Nitrospirota bacterium]